MCHRRELAVMLKRPTGVWQDTLRRAHGVAARPDARRILPVDKAGAGRSPSVSARMSWPRLLGRIYEVLPPVCPACGGEMRVISFITDPPTVRTILLHLELPHRPSPLAPARAPPQAGYEKTSSSLRRGLVHLRGRPPSLSLSKSLLPPNPRPTLGLTLRRALEFGG
jgi:hypothetical protein